MEPLPAFASLAAELDLLVAPPHGFGNASAFSTPARWLRDAERWKKCIAENTFERKLLIS